MDKVGLALAAGLVAWGRGAGWGAASEVGVGCCSRSFHCMHELRGRLRQGLTCPPCSATSRLHPQERYAQEQAAYKEQQRAPGAADGEEAEEEPAGDEDDE